jgi:hypothetical protein
MKSPSERWIFSPKTCYEYKNWEDFIMYRPYERWPDWRVVSWSYLPGKIQIHYVNVNYHPYDEIRVVQLKVTETEFEEAKRWIREKVLEQF